MRHHRSQLLFYLPGQWTVFTAVFHGVNFGLGAPVLVSIAMPEVVPALALAWSRCLPWPAFATPSFQEFSR